MGYISNSQLKTVQQKLVDNLKNGVLVPEQAKIASNIKPYSDDSGALQENPFISQGTGTNNNTEIVTTGDYCEIKSKNGNTIPFSQLVNSSVIKSSGSGTGYSFTKNQDGSVTFTITDTIANNTTVALTENQVSSFLKVPTGNKCWYTINNSNTNIVLQNAYNGMNYSNIGVFTQQSSASGFIFLAVILKAGLTAGTYKIDIKVVDITSWDSDIITDLTTNPSHFSWYYNGSLAYGSNLVNANGRYLECGQGRNLWDEVATNGGYINSNGNVVTGYTAIASTNYIRVTPNTKIYFRVPYELTNYGIRIAWYDSNKQLVKPVTEYYNGPIQNVPANAYFMRFNTINIYGATYKNDITISLYYTPEQGGEGYNQYYPYVAPKVIDTGSEELLAFDKKTNDGTIYHNTLPEIDLSTLTFGETTNYYYCAINGVKRIRDYKGISSKYTLVKISDISDNTPNTFALGQISTNDYGIYVSKSSGTPTGTVQVEAETPTTEQGTPFSAYPDINDYSYMLWRDTDNNLVSVPQGASIFYPVNYAGTLDDLVSYVDGDVTNLAKKNDITDTALAERGYYKMQDLSSEITDLAGLTYGIKRLTLCGDVATLTIRAENKTGSEIASNTWLFSLPSSVNIGAITLGLVGLVSGSISNLALNGSENKIFATTALANDGVVHIAVSFIVA